MARSRSPVPELSSGESRSWSTLAVSRYLGRLEPIWGATSSSAGLAGNVAFFQQETEK